MVDRFVRLSADLRLSPDLTAVTVAAHTVADVQARWWSMLGYEGVGLRGGHFTTTDGPLVHWRLDQVRWVEDIAVDGTMHWNRATGEITASVTLIGAHSGRLTMSWNDWDTHATATVAGTIGGRPVSLTLPAP